MILINWLNNSLTIPNNISNESTALHDVGYTQDNMLLLCTNVKFDKSCFRKSI